MAFVYNIEAKTNPIVVNLENTYLHAAVDTNQTVDDDGWYYPPGAIVEVVGDRKVARYTGRAGKPFGIVKEGLSAHDRPRGLSPDDRILVVPFRFNRAILRGVASGPIAAGAEVVLDAAKPTKLKAAAPITASIVEGEADLTGAATNPIAVAGSAVAEPIVGIAWVGSAGDGDTIEYLV